MRRAWIILLLVAMLPVHGWAAAAMAVSMAATAPARDAQLVSAAETAAGPADLAMPCHGSADGSHASDAVAAADRAPHDCASCHLCHAWLAVLADGLASPVPATPADAPAAQPRDTGRLIAGCLERPPRA